MKYRRVLVLTQGGGDARAAFAALRALVPAPEHVTVLAHQPTHLFAWLTPAAPPDRSDAALGALDDLRVAARELAPDVEIRIASELAIDALTELVASTGIDLVALDALERVSIPLVGELRKRAAVAVLYLTEGAKDAAHRLVCVGLSARERWAMASFLAAHTGANDSAALLCGVRLSDEDIRQIRAIAGVTVGMQAVDGEAMLRRLLTGEAGADPHLIVLPRFPPAILLTAARRHPVLVLPSIRVTGAEWERTIDIPDLLDDGTAIRVRAEYAIGVGRRTLVADQELEFLRDGSVVARVISRDGKCELPSGIGDSLGVARRRRDASAVPSLEGRVAVIRPDSRPRVLFDVELNVQELRAIGQVTWAEPIGVRIRSTRSCRSLRAKLRAAGLPPIVIDTSTVLDEGDALDVSMLIDGVRLARTAARMRAHGFCIAAIVYRGPQRPASSGFAAVRPEELASVRPAAAGDAGAALTSRLDATTNSGLIAGNRIEVELDNPTARRWLLDSIDRSQRRVHFQVYMALDDDVGRPVEAALAAAAARGVAVRVLVDSLHGLHGSFGLHNPILDRLSSRPGVELRVGNPVGPGSALVDLKQRDHRKLVIADGQVALLGGRNLSHEYYAGFDEVPLNPAMPWRMVPWLDAGARVEGPAVAELERSFLEAWTGAGGAAFEIVDGPPAGATAARVIVHHGLRDAYTVDAFVGMIEAARSHVYVVTGFPLMLEIQHALLRALQRGVRVRILVGNLTPRHAGGPFAGPWAAARTVATAFVHSRVDPLVAAGGECYEFTVPNRPGWDRAVGDIRPHVHAKTMSVDGRVCAVGSANLDVTGGYWESELLLVVEDEPVATALEARFEALLATSARIDREDAAWKDRADRRRWMRYWPGVLSG